MRLCRAGRRKFIRSSTNPSTISCFAIALPSKLAQTRQTYTRQQPPTQKNFGIRRLSSTRSAPRLRIGFIGEKMNLLTALSSTPDRVRAFSESKWITPNDFYFECRIKSAQFSLCSLLIASPSEGQEIDCGMLAIILGRTDSSGFQKGRTCDGLSHDSLHGCWRPPETNLRAARSPRRERA